MTDETTDYTDIRIKHLELIQGVISRMSSNSNTVKRYAVVITAAGVSLGKFVGSPIILVSLAAIILVFALLDARYLRLERAFRDLFNEVRIEPYEERPDFRLTPSQDGDALAAVLKSWSVAGLYGALIIFVFTALFFIKS